MNKITKTLLVNLLLLWTILPALAKAKTTSLYIFGVAASPLDSTAYITAIQHLDTAYIDSKTKFLGGRGEYSIQLQTYMEQHMGKANMVTSIFFDENGKRLHKEWERVKNKTQRDTMLIVQPVIQEPVFKTNNWMKPVEVTSEKADVKKKVSKNRHNGKKPEIPDAETPDSSPATPEP